MGKIGYTWLNWPEIARNSLKWLKWLEMTELAGMAGISWKLLEMVKMAINGLIYCKCLEIDGNVWKYLKKKVYKCLEMDGNCWKLLDLAGNLMEMAGNDWNDRKWLNVV